MPQDVAMPLARGMIRHTLQGVTLPRVNDPTMSTRCKACPITFVPS